MDRFRKKSDGGDDQGKGLVDLKAALEQMMKSRGFANRLKHLDLYSVWEEVVGEEVASATGIRAFDRKTLRVWVASPPLLSELSCFRKQEILDGMNERLGALSVLDVRFYLR